MTERNNFKLVKEEAIKYYKTHTVDECFDAAMELYKSDDFQIQEVGVFLLGYSVHYNVSALPFLKDMGQPT